ncbi:hypothetical protein [Shouchella miscanthi]|uniref:Tyr recombinase domain-containing protein n=1 Tax=Shouchella miscanthi TaxID=2598861 RepID=A0ABU6NL14_9BACI|nr:hypothetical protein [Shouchella miscanthi]
MNWSDIDQENKIIKINKTLFFDNGQTMIQSSKTKSGRSIDIDENLLKKLQKFRLHQKEKFLSDKSIRDQDVVFTRPDGRYMRLAQFNDLLSYAI